MCLILGLTADLASAVQSEVKDATKAISAATRDTAVSIKVIQRDLARMAATQEKALSKCRCAGYRFAIRITHYNDPVTFRFEC